MTDMTKMRNLVEVITQDDFHACGSYDFFEMVANGYSTDMARIWFLVDDIGRHTGNSKFSVKCSSEQGSFIENEVCVYEAILAMLIGLDKK